MPDSSAPSGLNVTESMRCSQPKFTAKPSFAEGNFRPYLPNSPVMSKCSICSVLLP